MADVFTIDDLNALAALTAADEFPVWDAEASDEPTKKITAQNMANSVKSLASLPNTTEMNTAIDQSTADVIRTGDVVNNLTSGDPNPVSSGAVYDGIQQAKTDLNSKIIRLQDKFDVINVDETSDGDGDIMIDLDNTTYALIGCTPDRTGITGGYTGVFFVLPYGATTGGKYLAKILKGDMSILRNQKVLFKVNYIRRAD